MYCEYCGAELKEGQLFCPKCGSRIETETKQFNKKSNKGKKIIALICCIAILITGSIGSIIIVKKTKSAQNNAANAESYLYEVQEADLSLDNDTGMVYVNNIIIVFLKANASEDDINEIVTSVKGEIVGKIKSINQIQIRIKAHSLTELQQICTDIKENSIVEEAIIDQAFELKKNAVPNDPWKHSLFKKEDWSEDSPSGSNWWAEAINAPSAWDMNDELDTIKIGVIDDGFDTGHEDLKNKIKYVSPINNKSDHGSHVAGVIAAEANNEKGITGLVWKGELYTYDWKLNGVQNIVDKHDGGNWSTFNQILGATSILVQMGAKVINLSAGASESMTGTSLSDDEFNYYGYYSSLYLHTLLSNGYDFLIVQSAGNGNTNGESVDAIHNGIFASINEDNCMESEDIKYKDIEDRIVIVGAAQNEGNHTYRQPTWSNAGERVDICAPGVDIYSTVTGGFSGKYANDSGTSMASPIVTGVAALVWSKNADLSGNEVKEIICDPKNTKYEVLDNTDSQHPLENTYRMINAELALNAATNAKSSGSTDVANSALNNESAYKEYAKIYNDILNKYGKLRTSSKYYNQFYTGINYAELIDFNNDGIDELHIIYATDGEYSPKYTFEVWGYKDNTIQKLDSGEPYGTDGGVKYASVAEYKGQKYVLTGGDDSFCYSYFHGFNENDFKVVKSLEAEFDVSEYRIDGKSCSEQEYEKAESEWRNNVIWYTLLNNSYENDMPKVREIISRTEDTLGINSNKSGNSSQLTESELKKIAENEVGNVAQFEYHDYDHNGKKEAFFVSATEDEWGGSDIPWNVYFIYSDGNIEQIYVEDGLSYYFDDSKKYYEAENSQGFFCYNKGAHGSGWQTDIYSVKDGEPKKLDSSGIQGFNQKDNGTFYTTQNEFKDGGGHEYPEYELIYDSAACEFTIGSRLS